jgi:hypothetical protein
MLIPTVLLNAAIWTGVAPSVCPPSPAALKGEMLMKALKNWLFLAAGCLFALGLMANVARATYVTDIQHMPSPGHTTLTLVSFPTPGGLYQIDSFFDVFTELQRVPPPPPGGTQIDSFFDVFTRD